MKYYAQIKNGKVVNMIVADNDDFVNTLPDKEDWKEATAEAEIGRAYINGDYDYERQAFLHPKPFSSWHLNETTLEWDPPIEKPTTDDLSKFYDWNDSTQSWDLKSYSDY
jgi:hypothetical protein